MYKFYCALALASVSAIGVAAPKLHMGARVIATVGPTVPASQFYAGMTPKAPMQKPVNYRHFKLNMATQTKGLTAGKVVSRHENFHGVYRPIFIVGDDATSLAWIKQYKHRLAQINAEGFLVNVTEAQIKHFEQVTGMHLMPINATTLMKRFHFKHYPVLISKHRIEQ